MGYRHTLLLVVVGLVVPAASAEEDVKVPPTVGEFMIDMLADAPVAKASACTAGNLATKAEYDLALAKFRVTVKAIVEHLLSKDQFDPLNHGPGPQELVDWRKAKSEAGAKRFENAEAPKDCQVFLESIRDPDVARMEPDISKLLAGVLAVIESKRTAPK